MTVEKIEELLLTISGLTKESFEKVPYFKTKDQYALWGIPDAFKPKTKKDILINRGVAAIEKLKVKLKEDLEKARYIKETDGKKKDESIEVFEKAINMEQDKVPELKDDLKPFEVPEGMSKSEFDKNRASTTKPRESLEQIDSILANINANLRGGVPSQKIVLLGKKALWTHKRRWYEENEGIESIE